MLKHLDILNEVQDATIEAITATRDAIDSLFVAHAPPTVVDMTLKRLFAYMSERSQAVSYLVSSGYPWDAEIVLRPLYEVNARIWLICLASDEKGREALVAEFRGEHAEIHNRKRANRAVAAAAAVVGSKDTKSDKMILSTLADDRSFTFSYANKTLRKKIEQKWSFTEIVRFLEKNAPDDFDMTTIVGMLHMYGLASHLIHADSAALDLMVDRKLRSSEECAILSAAHLCRIFSDQASLWLFSALALAHRFAERGAIRDEVFKKYARIHELSVPISEEFEKSQMAFYAGIKG
ncbi:DUF5677 domain-containing protein [Roseibium sp. LAB1]